MQCFICGKNLNNGYLCSVHRQELKEMLRKKQGIVENPTFKHHCLICGAFEGRILIEYPLVGYFCNQEVE